MLSDSDSSYLDLQDQVKGENLQSLKKTIKWYCLKEPRWHLTTNTWLLNIQETDLHGHQVWTLSSWLPSCRKCPSSRCRPPLRQHWINPQRLQAPVQFPVLASPVHPLSARNATARYAYPMHTIILYTESQMQNHVFSYCWCFCFLDLWGCKNSVPPSFRRNPGRFELTSSQLYQ